MRRSGSSQFSWDRMKRSSDPRNLLLSLYDMGHYDDGDAAFGDNDGNEPRFLKRGMSVSRWQRMRDAHAAGHGQQHKRRYGGIALASLKDMEAPAGTPRMPSLHSYAN